MQKTFHYCDFCEKEKEKKSLDSSIQLSLNVGHVAHEYDIEYKQICRVCIGIIRKTIEDLQEKG